MNSTLLATTADRVALNDTRSVDELDAAIGKLVRQMNADSYCMLVLVREFDDRFGWKKWTFKSCAEWLAWRSSISLSAAREKVRSAHALEATVAQVEERCRQIRNVGPDSTHHARRAWQSRSLTAWRDEARGTLRLTVDVPIEDGELILRALDCAVTSGEVTTAISPDAIAEAKGTAWRAQQADALIAVVKSYLDGGIGQDGGATADHYQVVLHADAAAVANGTGWADLPIDTMKRLLCDCSFVTVAEDANGHPLDVGRKQRTVSTPLRRALYARDRGCTFPGCQRKRYLDGHHLRHWVDGGATSAENMTLLCTHHHKLLHEGGFRIVRDEGRTLRFVTADGRSVPRGGYRIEDFVDDDVDAGGAQPSREGFCTVAVQREWERGEVRETAAVYRLRPN